MHKPAWAQPPGLRLPPPPGHRETLPARQTSPGFSGVEGRRTRARLTPTIHHLAWRRKVRPDAPLHPLQTRGLLLDLLVLLRLRRRRLLPRPAHPSASSVVGGEGERRRESRDGGQKQARESEEEETEDRKSQCEGQRQGQKLHIVLRERERWRNFNFVLIFRKCFRGFT